MSLAELNTLRRTARDLGIEGAARMNLAAVKEALAKHADDERHFAETMTAEENAQDTPEAAAAYEKAMTSSMPDVIGTCEGCGEAIAAVDPGVETDDAGMWCRDCATRPYAGPNGVEVNPLKGDGTDDDEPQGDGVIDEPRHDCTDPECAAAASMRDAVETREDARHRIIAEDNTQSRAVLDVTVERRGFRHLAIPGLHVTVCMKARPTGRLGTGTLDSVDCLDCLDKIVELASRP